MTVMQPLEAVGSFFALLCVLCISKYAQNKYKDSGGTDMYEKEVEQLQNIIDDSKRIGPLIFSTGIVVSGVTILPLLNVSICSSFSFISIFSILNLRDLYGANGSSFP